MFLKVDNGDHFFTRYTVAIGQEVKEKTEVLTPYSSCTESEP